MKKKYHKNSNTKIFLVLLFIFSVSCASKYAFADDTHFIGEWLEAKWMTSAPCISRPIYTGNGSLKDTANDHLVLNIASDYLSIYQNGNTKNDKINYNINKKANYTFLDLDCGSYLKKINENMILYYDKHDISPILFVRKGYDITFSGKNISGKWIYTRTGELFDFSKNELIMRSLNDGEIRKAKFLIREKNGSNTYDWMNVVYQAIPIDKDNAVLYTQWPGLPVRSIRILQKIR